MHVERGISATDLGTKRVDPQFGSRRDGTESEWGRMADEAKNTVAVCGIDKTYFGPSK